MSDLKPDMITFDEAVALDWPYIMGAVLLSDNQVWWENVRMVCGPIEGEDKEQMTISTSDEYDNIVTFGRVLAETLFSGTEEPVKSLLAYFEKPHKWESEYQKWRELGGTLDRECLEAFEDWHEEREMEALNQ